MVPKVLLPANIINPSAPKRNSPAQAPGRTVFAIQYAKNGGLRREGLGGEPSKAGLFKVFHIKRLVEGGAEAKKAPLCKGSCQRS